MVVIVASATPAEFQAYLRGDEMDTLTITKKRCWYEAE
jgi:hypothetical protein